MGHFRERFFLFFCWILWYLHVLSGMTTAICDQKESFSKGRADMLRMAEWKAEKNFGFYSSPWNNERWSHTTLGFLISKVRQVRVPLYLQPKELDFFRNWHTWGKVESVGYLAKGGVPGILGGGTWIDHSRVKYEWIISCGHLEWSALWRQGLGGLSDSFYTVL